MSSFYIDVQQAVDKVVSSTSSSRKKRSGSPQHSEIIAQIEQSWNSIPKPTIGPVIPSTENATDEQKEETEKASAQRDQNVDLVRGVLDVVGREIVVGPILSGQLVDPVGIDDPELRRAFQNQLQNRLDIVLALFEVVYSSYPDVAPLEPGAVFIPILEELVELISVESWRDLWTYVETRSKRFTKNMPASRGKALPLLRTINAFLRFLPRTPADLVFRGRVHQFASSVIGIADKSAINMRGDYADIKTTWEVEPAPAQEEKIEVEEKDEEAEGVKEKEVTDAGADGDVEMEEGKETQEKEKKPKEDGEKAEAVAPVPDFYSTLWSLQHYFSSPPTLAGPAPQSPDDKSIPITPFEDFKQKTEFVLPKLFEQTLKEKAMMGKEDAVGKKRKREAAGFFHPRYLTPRRLLDHELADPSFRRQILVQYFILFQFLLNLTPASASKQAFTGGMPKDFVLESDNETWIKSKIGSIRDELRKMPGDGQRFEETVLAIIARERHYAQWKNDACPEGLFEIPPLGTDSALAASEKWDERVAPPNRWPFPLGTRSLSKIWNHGFHSLEQLKGWKRESTTEELQKEIETIEADEEDDRAMGITTDPEKLASNTERKINLNWRAIRLASRDDLRLFGTFASERRIQKLGLAKVAEAERLEAIRKAAEEKAAKVDEGGKEAEEGEEGGETDGEKSEDDDVLWLKKAKSEPSAEESTEEHGEGETAASGDGDIELEEEDEKGEGKGETGEAGEDECKVAEATNSPTEKEGEDAATAEHSTVQTPRQGSSETAEEDQSQVDEQPVAESEPEPEPEPEHEPESQPVPETVQQQSHRPQFDRPPPKLLDDAEMLDAE